VVGGAVVGGAVVGGAVVGGAVVGGAVVAGRALATTSVILLPGRTPAPDLRDWAITVPAGDRPVDRYLTVALSPRSASAPFALASSMPAMSGTSTF
jgi:hypothetical protein